MNRIFCHTTVKAALFVLLATISLACSSTNSIKNIEVFMVMETNQDHALYEDMEREALLYNDIDFTFHATAGTTKEQIEEIESAIVRQADCFVIVCKDERELLPVMEEAYDTGIKTVILGSKIDSRKYTAHIGRDSNKEGRMIGELLLEYLPDGGKVAEIVSDETEKRFHEFKESLDGVLERRGDVISETYESVEALEKAYPSTPIDIILSPSEEKTSLLSHSSILHDIKRIGFNGSIEWGTEAIKDKNLTTCLVNQQGGSTAINTAVSIVKGLRYERDVYMEPIIMTPDNINLAVIGAQEHSNLIHKVDIMNEGIQELIRKNENMKMILMGLLALFGILTAITLEISHIRTNEEEKLHKQALDALEAEKKELQDNNEINETIVKGLKEENAVLLEAMTNQDSRSVTAKDPVNDAAFMNRFNILLEKEYSDSNLSIESIATSLNISRTQLFRKVKACSGSTPNGLLQDLRLEKGRELLSSGKASVSETAYSVGFTSPSYFTKCYKEKFGSLPSGTKS